MLNSTSIIFSPHTGTFEFQSHEQLYMYVFFYTCSRRGNVLNHVIHVTYNFRTPCMIYFISEKQSNKRAARKQHIRVDSINVRC